MNSKIKKAFCPPADDPGAISQNPIMDWVRHIVFAKNGQFELRRRDSDGGPKYGVGWCTPNSGVTAPFLLPVLCLPVAVHGVW